MKRASAFVISLGLLVCVLVSACNNDVDDMLDDYNGGFDAGYLTLSNDDLTETVLEPGDEGFSQNDLLFQQYTVYDIATLNLAAPESCKSFEWVLTDPKGENPNAPVTVRFEDGTKTTKRRTQTYIVYMPKSGLEIGHTYYLTLTVVGKDGRTYTDLAQIFTVEFHVEVDLDS